MQDAGKQLPTTSASLNYYPQSGHISKLNELVKSPFSLSNGYTLIPHGCMNNVAHTRAAPYVGYSSRGMIRALRDCCSLIANGVTEFSSTVANINLC